MYGIKHQISDWITLENLVEAHWNLIILIKINLRFSDQRSNELTSCGTFSLTGRESTEKNNVHIMKTETKVDRWFNECCVLKNTFNGNVSGGKIFGHMP